MVTPNRASDATTVRSELGLSLVELCVNKDVSPLQLNPVMRVKMPPGKAQEGVVLMENTVKSFSWMESRLGWVWCPLLGRGYLAQTSPKPDLWCRAVPSKSCPQIPTLLETSWV